MKRLFIGTKVENSLFEFLYKEIQEDFNKVCSGKWVEIENLHFTYKFLGDVDDKLVPEILFALRDELTTFDTKLILKCFGVFPNPIRPNVLFCKIFNYDKTIYSIQKKIETKLESIGFQMENRMFKAHLTLRRIKSSSNNFSNILSYYNNFEIGEMQSFDIKLFESKLTPQGPIYKIIENL